MDKERKCFRLSSTQTFLTPSREDAYRVLSGSLFLYLVPVGESGTERRLFLAEIEKGGVFPGYVWQDYKKQSWVFLAVPRGDTELEVLERASTSVLQRRFCKDNKIEKFESEGFFNALLDHYHRRMVVPEKGLLEKNRQAKEETRENIRETIAGAFSKEDLSSVKRGRENLYNAVAMLCHECGIPLAAYERVRKAIGYKRLELEDIARISNFAIREVVLEEGWEKTDAGPILAFSAKGRRPLACIPVGTHGYELYDAEAKARRPLDARGASELEIKGFALYRPLPEKKLGSRDVLAFCRHSIKKQDLRNAAVFTLIISLLNLLIPVLNQTIYDKLIPLSNLSWVVQIGLLVGSFMLANIGFSIVKALAVFRMSSHISNDLQSAFYDRIFKLPQSAIESVESGDLTQRLAGVSAMASGLSDTLVSTGLSVAFNVIFLIQLFVFPRPWP